MQKMLGENRTVKRARFNVGPAGAIRLFTVPNTGRSPFRFLRRRITMRTRA